jgi:palmitoyl-protein thioesterase
MFHGLGDFCENPGIIQIDRLISKGTGGKTKCIDVGLPSLGEFFNNFEHVAEVSCQKMKADETFSQASEYNVIGLSQGGLLARYIVEKCDLPGKARNLATLGGPHMGVAKVPHCFSGFLCTVVNAVAEKLVYLGLVQDVLVPAGYFRDVNNYDTYLKDSVFLPAVNNEKKETFGWWREFEDDTPKFADLNGALLVMFSEDTMIYPKETAWFQGVDTKGNVLPLNEMDFYNDDYIGLKSLNEAGKVTFETFEGDHLEFSTTQVNDIVVPFLNS